jgi:thioredoxin reductase (NADPH)
LDAVNYLANVVSKVYFIHNYDKPIGSEEMVDQVLKLQNITSVPNSRVAELKGVNRLEKIVVNDTSDQKRTEIEVAGIFIEVGYIAKTSFLKDLVKLNSRNEIEIDQDCKTSHPGIFAAGDVTECSYKQAAISAAQGCTGALSAYNYIQRLRGKTAAKSDWRAIKPVKSFTK